MCAQKMGVYFSPRMLHDPDRVEKAIMEAEKSGYDWVNFHAGWHTNATVADKLIHDAIKKAVEFAHGLGLKVMVDMTPEWWVASFMDYYPEAVQWSVCKAEGTCTNGTFTVTGQRPPSREGQRVFEKAVSIFIFDQHNHPQLVKADVVYEQFWDKDGPYFALRGRLDNDYNGKIIIYSAFAIYHWMDFSHPSYLKIQRELLDMYRDVPLDGIQWDEPGKADGLTTGYKAGEGFFRMFEGKYGYDLSEKMIYLDLDTGSPEATRVRIDYRNALTESLYNAQKEFNDYARSIFGTIEFGIHQTWSGFHIDFKAGCFDYFQLGKNLTAAYTDCMWNGGAVAYNYFLTDSLRKELGLRDAFVNDWSLQLTAEQIAYYCRIKKLFHINWKNIYCGDFGDGLPLYPMTGITPVLKDNVKGLHEFDRDIGESYYPHSATAVWHSWEGIAYFNSDQLLSDYYHGNLWDWCERALLNSVWFDFVSTGALETALVDKGSIIINDYRYSKLVLPWSCAVTEKLWLKIKEIIAAGLPVVFTGPPPQIVIETGEDVATEFAEMSGLENFPIDQYLTYYREKLRGEGRWESGHVFTGENERLRRFAEIECPLKPNSNTQCKIDEDGITVWTKASDSELYYLPHIYPGEDLLELLKKLNPDPQVEAFLNNAMYRKFVSKNDPDDFKVVCAAKRQKELDGILKIKGVEHTVTDETFKIL